MSAKIYYFSGTGNSLFVARELCKRIPDCELVPIVSLLKQKAIRVQEGCVGLVFPVHALTLPIAMRQFLRKADFSAAGYVFAVATRLGFEFRRFKQIDKLIRPKKLDAGFLVTMGNNDPRVEGFATLTETELAASKAEVLKRVDVIAKTVNSRAKHRERDTSYLQGLTFGRIGNFLYENFIVACSSLGEKIGGVNYFYADSKCTGCGICEKTCTSQKIKMEGKRPVWQRKTLCYMCYACVNYCPVHAVQVKSIPGVKSNTPQNGRYPHPYATVKDISQQKD